MKISERFLVNSSETGRFIVKSLITNRSYYIEPIGDNRSNWGDVNPATGKLEGNYGGKYKGSISEGESLITEENGFSKIKHLKNWSDVLAEIEARDKEIVS